MLENDGSGGFPDPGRFPVGGATEAVAVADLDGDGKADIACAKGAADEVAPGNPPRNPGKTRCQSNLWLPPSR